MSQSYLRHFASFVEIIRSGSMAAASERSGLAVSALSRSLSILENYYGFKLALRTPRGLVLTERGKHVFEEAEKIVQAATTALSLKHDVEMPRGQVVVSAPREVCYLWLDSFISKFTKQNPGIALRLLAADELVDPRRQRIDIVLRVTRNVWITGFDIFFSAAVEPVLVAPKALRIEARVAREGKLLPHRLLQFSTTGKPGPLLLQNKRTGSTLHLQFSQEISVSDPLLAIKLCKDGLGLTSCLKPSVMAELSRGDLYEPFPKFGFPVTGLLLGVAKGDVSPATKLVLISLRSELQKTFLSVDQSNQEGRRKAKRPPR